MLLLILNQQYVMMWLIQIVRTIHRVISSLEIDGYESTEGSDVDSYLRRLSYLSDEDSK